MSENSNLGMVSLAELVEVSGEKVIPVVGGPEVFDRSEEEMATRYKPVEKSNRGQLDQGQFLPSRFDLKLDRVHIALLHCMGPRSKRFEQCQDGKWRNGENTFPSPVVDELVEKGVLILTDRCQIEITDFGKEFAEWVGIFWDAKAPEIAAPIITPPVQQTPPPLPAPAPIQQPATYQPHPPMHHQGQQFQTQTPAWTPTPQHQPLRLQGGQQHQHEPPFLMMIVGMVMGQAVSEMTLDRLISTLGYKTLTNEKFGSAFEVDLDQDPARVPWLLIGESVTIPHSHPITAGGWGISRKQVAILEICARTHRDHHPALLAALTAAMSGGGGGMMQKRGLRMARN